MKTKKIYFNDKIKITLLSIFIGFLFGAIMLLISGLNPIEVYKELFKGIFSKPKYMVWSIIYATPIMLTGLAFVFANKTGLFNIGLEGQYIMGSLAAMLVGYFVHLPFYLHIPLTILAACLAGMLWGALVGFLKVQFGVNEVVSCIMLNWVAFYFANWVISLPKVALPNSQSSQKIQETAQIGFTSDWISTFFPSQEAFVSYQESVRTFLGPKANFGIFIAIATVFIINYILFKTKYGFTLRAVGSNKHAAEYAGINVKQAIIMSMGISGLLAGLAGAMQVMGNSNQLSILSSTENFGFDGISVALIGFMSPIGVIFSSLFMGAMKYGGSKLTVVGAPSEIVNIITGLIIYCIAISNGLYMLLGYFKKRGGDNQ